MVEKLRNLSGPQCIISAYTQDYKLKFSTQTNFDTLISNLKFYFQYDTVKPRKEEPRKLRTNRLFLKILYPLVKNQCQGVFE